MNRCRRPIHLLLVGIIVATAHRSNAAGNPHSYRPTVALSDNADEPDGLGWCMDILGPVWRMNCTEPLHLHSCKPSNTTDQVLDMLFEYNADQNLIQSAHYTADCKLANSSSDDDYSLGCVSIIADGDMTVVIEEGAKLELAECVLESTSPKQLFVYNATTKRLHVMANDTLCVVGDSEIVPAGPYHKRQMYLQACGTVNNPVLEMWTMQQSRSSNNATQQQQQQPTASPTTTTMASTTDSGALVHSILLIFSSVVILPLFAI